MKYLSLCSGIGGFELGMLKAYVDSTNRKKNKSRKKYKTENDEARERLEPEAGKNSSSPERLTRKYTDLFRPGPEPLTCVGYAEIDKYAIQIYERHFPSHKNYGDIRKIKTKELPDFDFLVAGFPCQSFSIAGKRLGFSDKRGELIFDIARIIKDKKPKQFLLENVKGLISHDDGRTFKTIITTLTKLGYDIEWQVLNSKDFGIPQNRERVFIVGHLRRTGGRKIFPFGQADPKAYKANEKGRARLECLYDGDYQSHRVYAKSGLSPTVPTSGGGHHIPLIAPTLDANYAKGINVNPGHASSSRGIQVNGRIRRLTPTECERLQGFPEGWTKFGIEGEISDTQRYKTLGNAVTTNVVREIIDSLIR